ncbi:IS256 family transposase [Carboxydocella sp. ULO1]|nr:IS256 family transposase [Carboxydocella sp. ULO1]
MNSEISHHLILNGAKDEGVAKLLESLLSQILRARPKSKSKLTLTKELTKDKIVAMAIIQEI